MMFFWLIARQSIALNLRKGGGAWGGMAFYCILFVLFTFALGPEIMRNHLGAAMSISLLLAMMTGLPLLYERDYEDGMMEQYLLQPVLLEWIVLAKICGQWLSSLLPMLLISPLLALMADAEGSSALWQTMLLGLASPSLLAIGSIAAALTLGHKKGGLLLSLLVLPLVVPVIIFATAIQAQTAMLALSAMMFALLPLSCLASAALIRAAQE